jgi:hypothetical protein
MNADPKHWLHSRKLFGIVSDNDMITLGQFSLTEKNGPKHCEIEGTVVPTLLILYTVPR